MRAVAYCRVSTNESDQLNSLHNQLQHYTELFSKSEYTPVKVGMLYKKSGEKKALEGIFADEGITGTKKKNRKAMDYLIKCAENKEFDIVYCKNVQRFARSVVDGASDLKKLKQLDIKVIFEDGNLNYHEHEAIINMFLSISQEESRMKSVACKFGIRKAQLAGKWTSNTPYGYDRVDGFLQINEKEAEVVKKIYNLYLNDGYGHKKIVNYLISNNIQTKKNGIWHTQHVKTILSNPLYTGKQTTHKSENMDINIRKIKYIPETEWIQKEFGHLKIIDEYQWNRVQDLSQQKLNLMNINKIRPSTTNLFSTIVICGNCGGILRRKQKRTKVNQVMVYLDDYEWVCQNNDLRGTKVCKNRNAIDEKTLLEFVKYTIQKYRTNPTINDIKLNSYIQENFMVDNKVINNLNNEMHNLKEEFNNQIRLNSKNIITDDELEIFTKEYRQRIDKIERELLKFKNISSEIEQVKRDYADFLKYVNDISFDTLTNMDLKRIFKRIVVTTIDAILDSEKNLKKEYDWLANYSHVWINTNKCTAKTIVPEFLTFEASEGKLLFE